MSKKVREFFSNAYGDYYTTENGDKMNYTLYDSSSDKVAVLLPGFAGGSVHYSFDPLAKELDDEYTKIHEDITANPQSRTVSIDGGHTLTLII